MTSQKLLSANIADLRMGVIRRQEDVDLCAERDRLKAINAELLEALVNLRPLFDNDSNLLAVYMDEIEACEAAIAKAIQG